MFADCTLSRARELSPSQHIFAYFSVLWSHQLSTGSGSSSDLPHNFRSTGTNTREKAGLLKAGEAGADTSLCFPWLQAAARSPAVMLPAHVSHHADHGSVTRTSSWPGAVVTWRGNASACGRTVPAQRKRGKWTAMGRRWRAGTLLSGAVGGWVRLGVVWNRAHAEARIKHVHVRHSKRLAVYFSGEIEVYLILLEDISLRAVARSRSPPSPSATCTRACSHTHTHNGFFVGVEKCSTGSCTSQNTALFASRVMMDHCGEP